MLLEGQVHGGIVQGLGQALLERTCYDPDTGQLLSGSFMDLRHPARRRHPDDRVRAQLRAGTHQPARSQRRRESGCTAACPAVMNAIVDALAPLGIMHIDMPATPERIWAACARARGRP